ncbi:MAG: type IV pilus assembly protein PilM [Candidatus Moranbacteria bacterium]|jgi:type IV pilus assembly protein PilM|nr:type IV pilus assembly protein PilM [Candidatus Moranbacteria bacterium]MDD5652355.1 type IV pilus assembly protein PilM [Candidatus Moranbacteria bacterium]MDX9855368.1 type IV pilus assembly protein PilM [Candidatus Moranbacteria bacterium]
MGFFNKKLIDFSDRAMGISIGDSSIKVVFTENGLIKGYNSVSLSTDIFADGEIVSKDKLIEKIKKAVSGMKPKKSKTNKVRISLPESKSFLRLINMPDIGEEEMEEAVKWELEANIPLSVDQVYYDWQSVKSVFAEEKGKTNVLVLAASKKVVNDFLEIFDEAGLEVVGIESESSAMTRSLLGREKNKKTSLIIDLGRSKSNFIFTVNGVPCFTSSVPISEKTIISEIAKKFNISTEKAVKIEKENGIGHFFEDDPLFESIKSVLNGLVDEIKKSIDFYLEGLKYSDSIDKIVICGKLSGAKGMIPYLSKEMKNKVEEGNIRTGLNPKKKILPIIEKEDAIGYATAIGLSLAGE